MSGTLAVAFTTAEVYAETYRPRGVDAQGEVVQRYKIGPSSPLEFQYFGQASALFGDIAVVGSPDDGDNGFHSGSVHVFNTRTGMPLYDLVVKGARPLDSIGWSVAVTGEYLVVGAPGDQDRGDWAGAVYVFDPQTGNQIYKLFGDDTVTGDNFGTTVAIFGDILAVGAPNDDDGGLNSGSAYIFDLTSGSQTSKITASDPGVYDSFGYSVGVNENIVIVGAYLDGDASDEGGLLSGSAYIFDITTGNQLHKLTASDPNEQAQFGWSVAVSGDTVVVGSKHEPFIKDDGTVLAVAGSAYLFNAVTGDQVFKLTAGDAAAYDYFGYSVSISSDYVIVGAYRSGAGGIGNAALDSGASYVFDTSTGKQLFKLAANDLEEDDRFGRSVAISGDIALIGAHHDEDGDLLRVGSAYIFDLAPCPEDLNHDGIVDAADLGLLIQHFGGQTSSQSHGDINGDAAVDAADLGVLITKFGTFCE